MILIKNNKVIAISEEIASKYNLTLENLSQFVKDIQIAAISKEPLTIENHSLELEEINLISTENIKAYLLKETSLQTPTLEVEPKASLETLSIEPNLQNLEVEPKSLEKTIEEPKPLELPPLEPKLQNEIKPPQEPETQVPPPPEPIQEPTETKPIQELSLNIEKDEVITLTFDDEFEEIEKMLNLSAEEAKKAMQEELSQAAKDLSIDLDMIKELSDELFKMFKDEKDKLFRAISKKDYEEIHKIAHKLKGAALNLRLQNLAFILKNIDEKSKAKEDISKIEYLSKKFYDFIDKINSKDIQIEKQSHTIPEDVKELILKIIEEYLTTQNEKKFQKEKKYIEKLLKIKINSLEDLQKIVKDEG